MYKALSVDWRTATACQARALSPSPSAIRELGPKPMPCASPNPSCRRRLGHSEPAFTEDVTASARPVPSLCPSWHPEISGGVVWALLSNSPPSLDFVPLGLRLTSEPFPAQPSAQPLPVPGVGSPVAVTSPSPLSQPAESPDEAVMSGHVCFLKTFLDYFILPASSMFSLKVQMLFKCRPWLGLIPN